ncbi:MAG: 5'/3'-nucleotidase SurE [Desulfobacterales bacterium]|nr:5'/3'-nucleotidase SurE [Desulfobacterales bacterium]
MKIVLTNDDGIDAPGLEALSWAARDLGALIVVAPDGARSGVGHRVTVREPIRVEERGKNRFSISGTPADCTRVALKKIAPDAGWVIAGINPGANLGSDVNQSGTVAAAREAAILGYRSISISQYMAKDHTVDWKTTRHHAAPILRMLLGRELEKGCFWNVNLPHPLAYEKPPGHVFCGLDANPHNYDYRREGDMYIYVGNIHDRPRDPGTDVDICFNRRKISITRISLGTTKTTIFNQRKTEVQTISKD